jgi:hypothetical protein
METKLEYVFFLMVMVSEWKSGQESEDALPLAAMMSELVLEPRMEMRLERVLRLVAMALGWKLGTMSDLDLDETSDHRLLPGAMASDDTLLQAVIVSECSLIWRWENTMIRLGTE